jgi:hypothetical protein
MSDQKKPTERPQETDAAKKRRREELMAKLASNTEAQNAAETTKRRHEELMVKLAADPRFKVQDVHLRLARAGAEASERSAANGQERG